MFSKIIYYCEKFFLPIIFLIEAFKSFTVIKSFDFESFLIVLDDIIKPLLFAVLLFISSSKRRHLNWNIFFGLLLSYASLYFLKPIKVEFPQYLALIYYCSLIFYIFFSIFSIWTLGRSFTILPSLNTIKYNGPYSLLKHPIYSSYIHFFIIYTLYNFNIHNLMMFALFYLGIYLRSKEEEKILEEDPSYSSLKYQPRFFTLKISLPVLLILITLLGHHFTQKKAKISVNISYPVYSLHPHLADDWSSFFVMNHIYPRFISKKGNFRNQSALSSKRIVCTNKDLSILSSRCPRIRFFYELSDSVISCENERYTLKHFKYELEQIVQIKNWLLPNFKWCSDNKQCFEFDNVENIQHRTDSIYFRFGWSLSSSRSVTTGIKPNCFTPSKVEGNQIHEGILSTKEYDITISTTNDKSDVFLYENSKVSGEYGTIKYFNPIYYFLVVNNMKDHSWISEGSLSLLRKTLMNQNIISPLNQNDTLTSAFKDLHISPNSFKAPKKMKNIILPDYISNCKKIEDELNTQTKLTNIHFECKNITEYVELTVKKSKNWDGFVSPLTPGMPGKDALLFQYFNPHSNDSWLGKAAPVTSKIDLLGVSEGSLTVKKGKFCSIKPNSLGLSDFTIDDLIPCDNDILSF